MLPTSLRALRVSPLRFRTDAHHLLVSRGGRLGLLHTRSVPRSLPVDIRLGRIPCHRHLAKRWATSTTPHSTASDPADIEAMRCLEQGTQKLEENDLQGAKELYRRSVQIKRNASSLFNLGVTHYHLKEFDEAIAAWKESIELQPDSPDVHTNLASAIAASLAPEDPEIAFNLAAVLEATGQLEEALTYYKCAKENGVEQLKIIFDIFQVSAKILGKTLKAVQETEPQGQPVIPKKPES
ncbi:hypothetical protein EDC04DRAFT_2890065 [Pisolithus marmoratus]|nr:hypothetical protein EDC04DRAFT_2890065 [Pisolithus marmoratus]